jgi:hypothetical protein
MPKKEGLEDKRDFEKTKARKTVIWICERELPKLKIILTERHL